MLVILLTKKSEYIDLTVLMTLLPRQSECIDFTKLVTLLIKQSGYMDLFRSLTTLTSLLCCYYAQSHMDINFNVRVT